MAPLAAAPGRPGGRHPLAALLEPRSVAVVGASARPGSFGDTLVAQLLGGGFRGPVHLVNPRYREVAGLPCLPSLADLPGPVDWPCWRSPTPASRPSSGRRPPTGSRRR
jgi:CoA binding domain